MIKILKEDKENKTNEQIEAMYDSLLKKVNSNVVEVINILIKTLEKAKDTVGNQFVVDELGKTFFDKNKKLKTPKDSEDRLILIDNIKTLNDMSDKELNKEIKDIVLEML